MTILFIVPLLLASLQCDSAQADDSNVFLRRQVPVDLEQYTSELARWDGIYEKTLAVRRVDNHSPEGIRWLGSNAWKPWDGQVIDPTQLTKNEFADKICPNGNTLPGLKELYDENQPFSDIYRPSKADVDEWHRLVINHIRNLVGYNTTEYMVKPDHCMHLIALWGQERRFTDKWNEKYPENTCQAGSSMHCGDTFRLRLEDQYEYLPEGHPGCPTTTAGFPGYASGISPSVKADIPWTINVVRAFCSFVDREGFWGGHVGPFLRREYFGFNFWDMNPDNLNSVGAEFRGRWTGQLLPHLYEQK